MDSEAEAEAREEASGLPLEPHETLDRVATAVTVMRW